MRAMACVALPMSAATAVQPMRYGLIKESHESWVALTPWPLTPQQPVIEAADFPDSPIPLLGTGSLAQVTEERMDLLPLGVDSPSEDHIP